jgi:hypothetical protein
MSEPKATASHLDSTRYALKNGNRSSELARQKPWPIRWRYPCCWEDTSPDGPIAPAFICCRALL